MSNGESNGNGGKKVFINQNSYFSAGIIALLVGGLVWLLTSIANLKSDITAGQQSVKDSVTLELKGIRSDIQVLNLKTRDRWTTSDMVEWTSDLRTNNVDKRLTVPKPEHKDRE